MKIARRLAITGDFPPFTGNLEDDAALFFTLDSGMKKFLNAAFTWVVVASAALMVWSDGHRAQQETRTAQFALVADLVARLENATAREETGPVSWAVLSAVYFLEATRPG